MRTIRTLCAAFGMVALGSATPAWAQEECIGTNQDRYQAFRAGMVEAFTGIDLAGNLVTLRLKSSNAVDHNFSFSPDMLGWELVLTDSEPPETRKACTVANGINHASFNKPVSISPHRNLTPQSPQDHILTGLETKRAFHQLKNGECISMKVWGNAVNDGILSLRWIGQRHGSEGQDISLVVNGYNFIVVEAKAKTHLLSHSNNPATLRYEICGILSGTTAEPFDPDSDKKLPSLGL